VIVRKAAQVFVSEFMLNAALWVADTGQGGRGNSLYVFPKSKNGEDFSKARIDKAIQESAYLRGRTDTPANVGLKRIGNGYLYVRGAQNRDQLISVDADALLFDEVAQYEPWVIDTALERLGSSLLGLVRAGSTPKYPSDEAARLWDQSSQAQYELRCSHCSTWQALSIQDNLDAERALVLCGRCKGDMTTDRLGEGRWVHASDEPGREWHGYQLTKLLSPRANLPVIAEGYLRILEGRSTATQEQEFWNSSAGLPHLPKGGSLSPDVLDACREMAPPYTMPDAASGATMGVDVGKRLHVRINVRGPNDTLRAVYVGAVEEFEGADGLDGLMARYNVRRCVIDANPETRKAEEFRARWKGRVFLAYYPNWDDTQRSELCKWDPATGIVRINRTNALDSVIGLVQQRRLVLPANARALGGAIDKAAIGEYYRHMGSPVRLVEDDARGNPRPRYDQNGPDHYCLIAGTPIETEEGPVPVERIVPGMRVATRKGYRRVTHAGQTSPLADVRTYTWSDGRTITATPNHPVYVPGRGFIPLRDLLPSTTVGVWHESKNAATAASPSAATPTATGAPTGCTSPQDRRRGSAGSGVSIRKSGETPTGRSPRDASSTTRTAIRSTTTRTTSCASREARINETTNANDGPRSRRRLARQNWMRSAPSPIRGIDPRRDSPGIASTGRTWRLPRRTETACASDAGVPSPASRRGTSKPGIAPRRASRPFVEHRGSTTSSAGAPSVEASTPRASTASNAPARGAADPVWLVGSVPAPPSAVYNLSVEGEEEYFANGILLHNCHSEVYSYIANQGPREERPSSLLMQATVRGWT